MSNAKCQIEAATEAVALANIKLDDLLRLAERPGALCRHDRQWLTWVDRNRRFLVNRSHIAGYINGLHSRHLAEMSNA